MSRYGDAYVAVNMDKEVEDLVPEGEAYGLRAAGWKRLDYLFGMTVAGDPDCQAELVDVTTDFGHALARRFLPTLYSAMDTDENALELVVDTADHYTIALKQKLAARWLTQD